MSPKKKPRRKPRQTRSKHTVESIVEAAVQIFSRHGYTATTSQIAERAGVSVGSLYQYYPNKDALLVELYKRHSAQAHAELHRVLDDGSLTSRPLWVLCQKLSQAMIELHLHQPELHRVLAAQVPVRGAYRRAKASEEQALFDKAVALFGAHPKVKVDNPARAALIVGQLLESMSHWYVLDAPDLGSSTDDFVDEQARLIELYLRDEPRARPQPKGQRGRAPSATSRGD